VGRDFDVGPQAPIAVFDRELVEFEFMSVRGPEVNRACKRSIKRDSSLKLCKDGHQQGNRADHHHLLEEFFWAATSS
jgi:hypothetical protein